MEVYDWLSEVSAPAGQPYDLFEVSFKNGARKEFFSNPKHMEVTTGDYVLVESSNVGYDIGRVSLSGELVKLQMRRKNKQKTSGKQEIRKIIRPAKPHELDKLEKARSREKDTMLRARVMARNLGLDMKLGDVEYQADLRKATFYYTANSRVDFRELIKVLAKEFRVKIEMRQIGSRQEAGRVGGIGSCGRELCCSTWLSDFSSVNTSAARYQNLAINQTKLSGQCGKLKCCLNYELDTYLEALRDFPDAEKASKLHTEKGIAYLLKTDILSGTMTYHYPTSSTSYRLTIENVRKILESNKRSKKASDLDGYTVEPKTRDIDEYEDLVGQISLKELEKSDWKRKKRKGRSKRKGK